MDIQDNFKINFIGIGAIKAASTWIYECLQEHPELCLAPKDQRRIAFFFKKNLFEKDLKDYKYFFKKDNQRQLKGDFHAGYLTSPEIINRVKEHNPDIKIVVCLRNPIARAFSEYRFLKFSKNAIWSNLEQGIQEDPRIMEHGLYYKYLKKYFKNFSRENILVLIYEDIKENPTRFIQRIYEFLGVDSSFVAPSINTKVNLTSFKSTKLGSFFHKKIIKPLLKNTKWAWKLKRSVVFKKLLCKFSELYSRKSKLTEEISPKTYQQLKNVYNQDIANLEKLINRDLSSWK